jgi:hypothetical protein
MPSDRTDLAAVRARVEAWACDLVWGATLDGKDCKDVQVLLAALTAAEAERDRVVTVLRELHMPIPRAHQDGGGYECAVCYDSDGVAVNYPCATIRLLTATPTETPDV